MARYTVRCYATESETEEPTLRGREMSRPVDEARFHAEGFNFMEVWVPIDMDLSGLGWEQVTFVPSEYGRVLWAWPRRRNTVPEADF